MARRHFADRNRDPRYKSHHVNEFTDVILERQVEQFFTIRYKKVAGLLNRITKHFKKSRDPKKQLPL